MLAHFPVFLALEIVGVSQYEDSDSKPGVEFIKGGDNARKRL